MKIKGFSIYSKIRLVFGVLLGLTLCPSTLFAQITAPAASYQSKTQYTMGEQNDIFVFCDESGSGVGELKAVSPDGTSGWDFTWTKWDSGITFEPSFIVEYGSESTVSGLEDGLYHVKIEKGTEIKDYQVWVINHLKSTNQPILTFDKKDCNAVFFNSSFSPTVYQYQNYPSSDLLDLTSPSLLTFVLNRDDDNHPDKLPNTDGLEKNFSDGQAFKNEADYTMTVIDECGFEYVSDPVENISTYVVDPTFTFDPASGDAPLEVTFEITNDNNNAEYQWYFYKEKRNIPDVDYKVLPELEDLLTDAIYKRDAVYTYMHPGDYFVKLRAVNNVDGMNCDESYIIDKPIEVKASLFEVPNVFTPNGDTFNDEFRLKLFSVKSYNAKIFNRWGRLVYEFEESDIQYANADFDLGIVGSGAEFWLSVKGWDGKINGKLATPGTYFYVIEAEGREEDGKHYSERGALTLLHNK